MLPRVAQESNEHGQHTAFRIRFLSFTHPSSHSFVFPSVLSTLYSVLLFLLFSMHFHAMLKQQQVHTKKATHAGDASHCRLPDFRKFTLIDVAFAFLGS